MTTEMDPADQKAHRPKGHATKSIEPTATKGTEACTVVTPPFYANWTCTRTDTLLLLLVTGVALIVRCWRLSVPNQVVFDEVHFGKFAGKYINGTYFYDLHPPLAKMMFAAAGKLAGYDGVFDFKSIGLDYAAAGVPYVGMRLLPAFLGALTVPATFAATRACGYRMDTAL
ncbi:Dolichyl-phosphate-mannose--protein mannosyltransferase 1, partial [Coemansia sp. S2]